MFKDLNRSSYSRVAFLIWRHPTRARWPSSVKRLVKRNWTAAKSSHHEQYVERYTPPGTAVNPTCCTEQTEQPTLPRCGAPTLLLRSARRILAMCISRTAHVFTHLFLPLLFFFISFSRREFAESSLRCN